MSRVPIVNSSVVEEDEDDEGDDDEAASAAETDASETNSYGSLTSVD